MKKVKYYLSWALMLTIGLNLAGQSFKGEEAAVFKAIEDDIKYFDQRDYEKWAAMWVHEPYVQNVWIGPDGFGKTLSWEDMDKFGKEFMRDNPAPVPTNFVPTDAKFLIRGDLAIVEYTNTGERFMRVLEKRGGAWKMAQIQRVQIGSYQTNALMNQLKGLNGEWALVPGTITIKNSPWRIENASCEVESTPSGFRLIIYYLMKNPDNMLQKAQDEIIVALNSADQQMVATHAWHWEASGQNFVSTGNCQQGENKQLTVATTFIDNEANKVQHNIHPTAAGKLVLTTIFFPGEDRQWSMEYTLERKN